jgi:hypothetical protein
MARCLTTDVATVTVDALTDPLVNALLPQQALLTMFPNGDRAAQEPLLLALNPTLGR